MPRKITLEERKGEYNNRICPWNLKNNYHEIPLEERKDENNEIALLETETTVSFSAWRGVQSSGYKSPP